MTSYNGQTITYDAIGNPLTYRDGITMTWQNGRELATLTKDGKTISYTYNADGIRTEKNNDGVVTKYFYDSNNNLTSLKREDAQLLFYYDTEGNPESVMYYTPNVSVRYHYITNLQGDIVKIVTDHGGVIANYQYDAYGKLLSVTSATGEEITSETHIALLNPLRYRGYVYDNDTGFYYLQSRYYDSITKRFINSDDLAYLGASGMMLGHNLFAYCENNPINKIDSSGDVAVNVIGAIIGAVIGVVGGAFLGKWLADKLGIKGKWKRAAFISGVSLLVGAASAAIGYFVGPYVAKAWSIWSAKLVGLVKGTFKTIAKISSKTMSHINVSKHLWNQVMKKVTTTQIQTIIHQGIRKGTWNFLSNGSVKILYKYGGKTIVITGKVVNDVFRIGNAWVWNGKGTP